MKIQIFKSVKFYCNTSSFIHLWVSIASLGLRWQSWITATKTLWSAKFKIFIIWSFKYKGPLAALCYSSAEDLLVGQLIKVKTGIFMCTEYFRASLVPQTVKNLPVVWEDPGSIPGSGRPPGEGNGYPLQYSCLENPKDRGTWWATVHGVTKSRTQEKWHGLIIFQPKLYIVYFTHTLLT